MNDFIFGVPGSHSMLNPSGLIWGLDFDGDAVRGVESLSRDVRARPSSGFRWLHISLADQRSQHWIEASTDLPESARELLLAKDSHQSALVDRGFVCGLLQDFERDFDADETQRLGSLRFVLGPSFMITARHHPVGSADIVRAKLADGARITSPAAALDLLVGSMIEAQTRTVRALHQTVQGVEDDLIDERRSPDTRGMIGARRQTVQLHRLLDGMRSVFQRIEHDEDLPPVLLPTVERIAQRIGALDADIVAIQSQLRLIREEMDSQATQRTNQNLYVLSIMTALMLPATFVTGIFGMNTGGLPWADSPAGTLMAFLIALASAFAIWILLRMIGLARR